MTDQILEGTWEEMTAREAEFRGRRVRVTILSVEEEAERHFYHTASSEEWERAFKAIGEGNEHLPVLPPEAFERGSLYDNRF